MSTSRRPGKREDHDAHERVALCEEVEAGWAERAPDVLEEQPQYDAGDESPPHREPDHECGLVFVHVDRVEIQQDEQRHQRGRDGQRDREEPSERETDDRREAERQRDAEVGHVGVGQLREQARHDVDRPRPLAGCSRELAPATATRWDRVVRRTGTRTARRRGSRERRRRTGGT